ncbi:MAG: sugar phosphate isomerase/epimerase [Saprospiraceae bacterium]|nr:sugar phosphate isomerase/epimerase [Saprospiraceae bacterium]
MNDLKRRTFLKYSAMAPVAFSVPVWETKKTGAPLIKKALKYGMIKENLSILDKFKLVKDLGFDGIELDSPNELPENEILNARDKTGIELPGVVNSVHWQSPLSDPDPAVRARCVESMKISLNDCKKYGGTTVLLVPAVVNDKVSYAEAYERSQFEIKKLLPIAEKTGIKIAFENVWNNFLLSPLEAARYVDEFNHPMVGWHFDIGNIVRYGWPEHWIQTLGKRILKTDIKDYSRKMANDLGVWKGFDAELGDGDANWSAVNKALFDIGYKGWGAAEVSGGDRVRLKEISERMDKCYAI